MKVLINSCFGGFGFSDEFIKTYHDQTGCLVNSYDVNFRTANDVIELFEKMGSEWSSDDFAEIKLVEIPDDVEWHISDYDGVETIHENHRSWY